MAVNKTLRAVFRMVRLAVQTLFERRPPYSEDPVGADFFTRMMRKSHPPQEKSPS